MTDAINGSRVGSPGSGSLANTLARELNSAKDRIAELEKTAARVVECDTCGNPWYHDWLSSAACPHCALAASQAALLRLRQRSQNQRRELRRLNNALRWLWDGVRYAHAMEAKMRADKELGEAR